MKILCRSEDISEFEITEDGVLDNYNGLGGDVVIPEGVTSIGSYAFDNCRNLENITIPNSVTSIRDRAFRSCTSLDNIKIPNSVTSIGDCAFYYCQSLKNISIPNSVTSISDHAFGYCTSLTSITIPDSVESIGEGAFSVCRRLTSITIPNSVTSIGDGVFNYCENLTTVIIPNSVTSIGKEAFYGCTNLENIKIPNSVTSIGKEAFYECDKLPNDVKHHISQVYGDNVVEYEYDEKAFEEWYESPQCDDAGLEFVSKLESLVRANYNVDEFLEEPSVRGYAGIDFILITLADGSRYEFRFDWYEEQLDIFARGSEAVAKSYFQEIEDGIDSGAALADD